MGQAKSSGHKEALDEQNWLSNFPSKPNFAEKATVKKKDGK